ncbi:hypothetical protein AVEN_212144-1 [Araneus ventricosus]|uniref:Uncharacterized protein n=1 Tax=Araneus ventricosus TaxID=182803 RepID=A0A4Y2X960_ARAVE|nr:hypothetical protein AVEN_212144-1 [Araneus ventricosus]
MSCKFSELILVSTFYKYVKIGLLHFKASFIRFTLISFFNSKPILGDNVPNLSTEAIFITDAAGDGGNRVPQSAERSLGGKVVSPEPGFPFPHRYGLSATSDSFSLT